MLQSQTRSFSEKAVLEVEKEEVVARLEKDDADFVAIDGNEAAAYVAYAMSENTFIYPITPASSMGEHIDQWITEGRKNIFGKVGTVDMMQSEAGAAGAMHGATASGSLSSTFTSSQGLLLKIPNMYAIAGELMPMVCHVAARGLTKHALSIHCDHQDVMNIKDLGWAMVSSSNVQEVMDLSVISYVATLKTRIPFLSFFDGFRTSHEISKIKKVTYDQMRQLFPYEALHQNLRKYGLEPSNTL